MNSSEIYRRALLKWGAEPQINMLLEECGELIAVINQYRRNRVPLDRVAEELADVTIVVEQATALIGDKLVEGHKTRKLTRLASLVDE